MKSYIALIETNLKLALREKVAIFFNYVFPLIFFFVFAQMFHAGPGGPITEVVTIVLVIGVLGNGLFGGGIRAVQDREQNILRRFKVAPISPAPILAASIVTGWALYIPAIVITVALAHLVYGMPIPERWVSVFALLSIAVVAFRAIGLIIASVANSMQESQILVQLVYMPMLFTSISTADNGSGWIGFLGQFLPATYLVSGLRAIMVRHQGISANWLPIAALLATTAVAVFVSMQFFRWEKGEKIRSSAKLWLVAVILPFLALGAYRVYVR